MRIVKFEFLKIITNRLFILMFVAFWFLNLLFLVYQDYDASKNGIPYKAYKLLDRDLKGKTHEEKGKFIDDVFERAKAINIIYNIENTQNSDNLAIREYAKVLLEENRELYDKYYNEAKNPVWKYTGNSDLELSFLQEIKNDYDAVNDYQKSLEDILNISDNLKSVSIFKVNDKNSLKSINKTLKAYKNIKDVNINYEVGKSLEKVSSVSITDFFVIVLIFIFSIILVTDEKDKNLLVIIKSTRNGQLITILSKIGTLFIGVLLVSIFFYGMNYLFYFYTLGFGNLFSTIQSTSSLLLSIFKINILEYLIIFFLTKSIYLLLVALLTFYVSIKFDNFSEILIVIFLLLLFNFVIYKSIHVTSNVNLFKYFNFIGLINTNGIFNIYDNLRFFNVVSKSSVLLFLQVLMIVIFTIFSINNYLKSKVSSKRAFEKLKSFRLLKPIKLNSIFYFEVYKLLFVNRGLVIILLFAFSVIVNFKNQNFNLSYDELFYKNYMGILSGKLNLEKEEFIKNVIREYDMAEEQLEIIRDKEMNGLLSNGFITAFFRYSFYKGSVF